MSDLLAALGVPADVFTRQVSFRRDLHQHPELSWQETRTAERIEAELTRLGLSFERVAETGVVAEVPGGDAPRIALRADTDALPITEETGLPFASQNPGVMHACGHDGHSSMLLGAAELLVQSPPPGPVRLLWQPAEEHGDGAPKLIAAGALDGVAAIFGGHVDRRAPAGVLVVTDGGVGASTDEFELEVHGQGGHGARPHTTTDAILTASHLVTALQSVVAREVDPGQPAVISIGSFHAGSAPNVIAGVAKLEGTLRAMHPDVRAHLRAALERVAESVVAAHGAKVAVNYLPGTPAVINDPAMTAVARQVAQDLLGAENVTQLETANMGGEDFSYYLEQVPGCYIRYGSAPSEGFAHPAHSSRFDIDERALAVGAAWLNRVARAAAEALR